MIEKIMITISILSVFGFLVARTFDGKTISDWPAMLGGLSIIIGMPNALIFLLYLVWK